MTTDKTGMPVKQEVFLEAGVHIGTKIRTNDMREYIFKRRDDGLFILDLRKSSEKLMDAARMIAKHQPDEVTVVASRVYSSNPATRFAELTEVNLIKGRFVPGTMTNMKVKGFLEPKLILVCDPKGEHEALVESARNGVPVIGLCDTDNETKFIDLVVPINNKGKRSLALIFYILSREVMLAQGKIKSYDEFKYDIGHFEQMIIPKEEKEGEGAEEAAQPEAEAPAEGEAAESSEEKAEETEAKAEAGPKKARKKEKAEKQDEPAGEKAEAAEESEGEAKKPAPEAEPEPKDAKEEKPAEPEKPEGGEEAEAAEDPEKKGAKAKHSKKKDEKEE